MQLYALLVGINAYPDFPLSQCVADAEKMENYLRSAADEADTELHIRKLTDAEATKENVASAIQTFLCQAQDDDVALFYFSGHGAYEDAMGRFPDEPDGLLECLVCCHPYDQETGYLLADKELRHLLGQLPANPHLVTVFDCCHSGDMVRAALDGESRERIKRLAGHFPARPYEEFLFAGEISSADLQSRPLAASLPFKNHVHIAACTSSQSSWEDAKGGVFTRYLLELLEATRHRISYQDITRWARISLKDITSKEQTPVISVQGKGKVQAASPWLNLFSEEASRKSARIVFNEEKGWYLTLGTLMGVKNGTRVQLPREGGDLISLEVTEAGLADSLVSDPKDLGVRLDPSTSYEVMIEPGTIYSRLALHLNDLDNEPEERAAIERIVSEHPHVDLTPASGAHFFVNIFNELVYLSQPNDPFRPLARQIDILDGSEELESSLKEQIDYFVKWNHFNTLENPDPDYTEPPIRVEVRKGDNADWEDATQGDILLQPRTKRLKTGGMKPEDIGYWVQKYEVRVTNISKDTLHLGVLTLHSDMGISPEAWQDKSVKLGPGESKYFFDHDVSESGDHAKFAYIEPYKEVYNWKEEWFHYKFIYNNFEDFSDAIQGFKQPALEHPLILSQATRGIEKPKGILPKSVLEPVRRTWGTLKTTLKLQNPEYNIISGELQKLWDEYQHNELLAPFLSALYLDHELEGLEFESESLPNPEGKDINQRSVGGIKKNLGNFLDNFRRYRLFKKARMRMTDKPVVIAEGDSWFLYPFLVKDIIDYVMEEFPVRSIAAAGDELSNYKKEGQLLKEVAKIRPRFVLISGGGNDIIGPEIQNILHDQVPAGSEPEDYLNEQFHQNMASLKELYSFFIHELKQHESVRQIFLHGYEYVRVDHDDKVVAKGWVNKYMKEKGILDPEDRKRLIAFLIDSFNEMLAGLGENEPMVTYLDLRNKVTRKDLWYDEIHPNDEGNKILGKIFIDSIRAFG